MRANGFATASSRILYNPGILSVALTDSMIIGIISVENLKMIGFSASSGNIDDTMSSLSLTSFVSTSISSPYSNSRVITEIFSRDLDVICFKSLTELRTFSSGRVTFCSISEALAPVYVVITIKVFVSISGYKSIGRFLSEKSPNITTATKQRIVMIGRLTALPYKLILYGI